VGIGGAIERFIDNSCGQVPAETEMSIEVFLDPMTELTRGQGVRPAGTP
jgi:hypothetical protein